MSISGAMQTAEFVYDFDVDGGVKDVNIVLSDKNNKGNIPVGAVIKGVFAKVITAVVGTSSTVSWGISSDPDGYSGTTIAEASLTANSSWNGYDNATGGALLWDDTNDHPIYPVVTDAATGSFVVLISTADLTAGKIVFVVEFYLPAVDQ